MLLKNHCVKLLPMQVEKVQLLFKKYVKEKLTLVTMLILKNMKTYLQLV